jgi:hypothetical protein
MKRLVFCFDGTSSRLNVDNPTNVVLTAESVLPLADDQKTAANADARHDAARKPRETPRVEPTAGTSVLGSAPKRQGLPLQRLELGLQLVKIAARRERAA